MPVRTQNLDLITKLHVDLGPTPLPDKLNAQFALLGSIVLTLIKLLRLTAQLEKFLLVVQLNVKIVHETTNAETRRCPLVPSIIIR